MTVAWWNQCKKMSFCFRRTMNKVSISSGAFDQQKIVILEASARSQRFAFAVFLPKPSQPVNVIIIANRMLEAFLIQIV